VFTSYKPEEKRGPEKSAQQMRGFNKLWKPGVGWSRDAVICLVSSGDWFWDLLWISKSTDAQVPCVKW